MRKGFTLIELLIVIAIIGLLATLAIVSLTTAQQKARDTKRIADLKQLQSAVELYFSQSGTNKYPNGLTVWTGASTATSLETAIGPYITNMPTDPSNTSTKVYTYAVINSTFDQYVLKAELEADNPALDGDDDVTYNIDATGADATQYRGVTSDDAAELASTETVNCTTEASPTFYYCVSE